ncbi:MULTISPECIES: DUF371 domain-containing protein [unclassified Methanoregula]|uniref:DUF371 domain-containing protein n=1 Tax=unclassified Methanoregula TaxID=2649730 RepID=UPI0009CC4728|nr:MULTISPECIES: DUF371 domain-containing protein [unclassified Methanoregula]OPX64478.1 MAG: hypothetical protein A4E33_00905 [Methanoregula sp. PtaB.Bin085]OPY35877.1 MAG: hypothetical protein A4E34_00556 [Methanoregula sp. PtaU1.Bin006]
MEAQEIIRCRGHPLVLGTHPTTFEVTREDHLTKNGNCIIGIASDKGCGDLSETFREILSHDDAVLLTHLACGNTVVEIRSRGSSSFTLDHPTDLVWRKSAFVCGRTIGILSDTVARTLPRELVQCLERGEEMVVTLTVTRPG